MSSESAPNDAEQGTAPAGAVPAAAASPAPAVAPPEKRAAAKPRGMRCTSCNGSGRVGEICNRCHGSGAEPDTAEEPLNP